ncbi:MAG: aspartate carbamoyltransferase [Thermoplasmatota archaeon]
MPGRASSTGPRHLTHIHDLSVEDMVHLLDSAERYVAAAAGKPALDVAHDKILSTTFFEPSTRTRLSFEAAMARLGGRTISASEPGALSVSKGETLSDTIRMVSSYSDVIVLRHSWEGSARLAARLSRVPVINAGDGAGQHPTQTLVDLYTIRRNLGRIEGNRVAIVGDLKYGRTVHSLADALARFHSEIVLVAPESLQLPADTRSRLEAAGGKISTANALEEVIGDVDVLYMTRIQKERFADLEEYRKVKGTYALDAATLSRAKKSTIVLHPLPRVDEVATDVDSMPQAKYFEQAAAGVPVRMAVLGWCLGIDPKEAGR